MKKALIVVDVQNDFCPGGALPVPDGDEVVKPINRMVRHALKNDWLTIASRDWHPKVTGHFKNYGGIWPEHCVMFEHGAEFHPNLLLPPTAVIISKGMKSGEDAYSAFDGFVELPFITLKKGEATLPLFDLLAGVYRTKKLYVCGLATDYCVKHTVLGALELGFKVCLLSDACKAVNIKPSDGKGAITEMKKAGAKITTTKEVLGK